MNTTSGAASGRCWAYLETGELDRPIDYFCEVAQARAAAIRE